MLSSWLLIFAVLETLAAQGVTLLHQRKFSSNNRAIIIQQQGNKDVIDQLKALLGKRLGTPLKRYDLLDRRIPLCLLDLYLEQHVYRSLARDALGFNVRCFTSRGILPNFEDTKTVNMNGFKFLHFNLSDVPSNEIITRAELRISRQSARRPVRLDMPLYYNSSHHLPQAQLYELKRLHPLSSASHVALSPLAAKLYTHRSVPWEAYDITEVVRRWREEPSLNLGLALLIDGKRNQQRSKQSNPPSALSPPSSSSSSSPSAKALRRRQKRKRGVRAIRQPVLVTYGDNGVGGQLLMSRPSRSKLRRKRSGNSKKNQNPSNQQQHQQQKERAKNVCKRRPLNISFRDIGWDDWILAPKSYKAFYCDGVCPTYLRDHMNATNHAIVQGLVHSVSPQLVSAPCCVPTELKPITILYVDEYDKVVLKNYNDMEVVGCGCR